MKLKWTLNELRANQSEPLQVAGKIDLEKSLTSRSKEILEAEPIGIKGYIIIESDDEFIVSLNLSVTLVMPSSRSLEPVEVELSIPFQETYLSPGFEPEEAYSDQEIVIELESDLLDLRKSLEDAIISSLPTQVFTEEEREGAKMPDGNQWRVVSEDAYLSEEVDETNVEDSPFASLKGLFDEEGKPTKEN